MKWGDVVDFTVARVNKRHMITGEIVRICPKCGRKGTVTRHRQADPSKPDFGYVTHKQVFREFCWVISDHCVIEFPPEAVKGAVI